MKITPEMIDRGAKALYNQHPLSPAMPAWEDLADTAKVDWWRRSRIILEAALNREVINHIQITDTIIEKAAQALYEMLADSLPECYSIVFFPGNWKEVNPKRQSWWRNRAREMLENIFGTPKKR